MLKLASKAVSYLSCKVEFISKCLKMNRELNVNMKCRTKNTNCYGKKKKKNTGNNMTGIPYEEKLNETYSNTT